MLWGTSTVLLQANTSGKMEWWKVTGFVSVLERYPAAWEDTAGTTLVWVGPGSTGEVINHRIIEVQKTTKII